MHERDGPTGLRLGRNVADHKPVRTTTEAPVREACHIHPEARAHDQAGRLEHLRHTCTKSVGRDVAAATQRTGAALGAEVAQDHDRLLALLNRAAFDGRDKVCLGVERTRLACELETLLAGDFGDGAARREVALQDSTDSAVSQPERIRQENKPYRM